MVKNVFEGYVQSGFEIGVSLEEVLHIYIFVLWDCNIVKQYLSLGFKKKSCKVPLYPT